jgi:hypothetical protein
MMRLHRNDLGKVVKQDDHGPDALMCAMLHFPFIDEFDTALGQMLSGTDRERLKVTNALLDGCIHEYPLELPEGRTCSMGVSMGSSGFYVVVSIAPRSGNRGAASRRALFIGRVNDWADLDALIVMYNVRMCLISPQPEPHLVQKWLQKHRDSVVQLIIYTNDGLSEPSWDREQRRVTVDRTFALNSAYEEIKSGVWWIPPDARSVDNGEFYAQMKAPTRVRDATSGEVRYHWIETGPLDHYRHAHAFDHLAADLARRNPAAACEGSDDSEVLGLRADYSSFGYEEH